MLAVNINSGVNHINLPYFKKNVIKSNSMAKNKRRVKLWVTKASGIHEKFSSQKLRRSLEQAGATRLQALTILEALRTRVKPGISTSNLYALAHKFLTKESTGLAARYTLKQAIMRLGPTGYPFEKLVGAIFEGMGYEVQTNKVYMGRCVSHEVDVVAKAGGELHLMECKYSNTQGDRQSVKVPLYIKSRSVDILEGPEKLRHQYHVVTNGRFSDDAEAYGRCAGLKLLGWDYPLGRGIKDLLESTGLYPITCLSSPPNVALEKLMQAGVVMTRQVVEDPSLLDKVPMSRRDKALMIEESRSLEAARADR